MQNKTYIFGFPVLLILLSAFLFYTHPQKTLEGKIEKKIAVATSTSTTHTATSTAIATTTVKKAVQPAKIWTWDHTIYSDDKLVKPRVPKKFTLKFNSDKTFSATTDCNSIVGKYTTNKNEMAFTDMMSTLMYCANSQESEFAKMLEQTQSYMFTSEGELVLLLKFDSGSVIFK